MNDTQTLFNKTPKTFPLNFFAVLIVFFIFISVAAYFISKEVKYSFDTMNIIISPLDALRVKQNNIQASNDSEVTFQKNMSTCINSQYFIHLKETDYGRGNNFSVTNAMLSKFADESIMKAKNDCLGKFSSNSNLFKKFGYQ